jgi:hypothetical protein
MSVWIRAVCKKSLSSVTPELLVEAVSSRVPTLVERYKPSMDEPLRGVLSQLRVEKEDEHPFGVWRLLYSADAGRYVRIDRMVGRDFEQARRDLFDEMTGREGEAQERVRGLLSGAKELVAMEVSSSDAGGMALVLAVAVAASLARAAEGLVRIDGEGWLAPQGKDVEGVLAEGA